MPTHADNLASGGLSILLTVSLLAAAPPARASEDSQHEAASTLVPESTSGSPIHEPVDPADIEVQGPLTLDGLPEPCSVTESDEMAPAPSGTRSRTPATSTQPDPSPSAAGDTAEAASSVASAPSPGTSVLEAATILPAEGDRVSTESTESPDVHDIGATQAPRFNELQVAVEPTSDALVETREPSVQVAPSAVVSPGTQDEVSPDPAEVQPDQAEEGDEDSGDLIAEEAANPDESVMETIACPVAPIEAKAEPGVNEVTVTWSPGVVPDDERFVAQDEYIVTVAGERTQVIRTADTSATVTGLRNGVEYEFAIYAVTTAGRSEPAGPIVSSPTSGVEGVVGSLIVEFKAEAWPQVRESQIPGEDRIDEVELTLGEQIGDEAVLVELSEPVDLDTAERLAADLAADEDVLWAEPDQFFFTSGEGTAVQTVGVPSDNQYALDQWNLWDDFGISIGDSPASMTDAWAGRRGDGVTVAIIDTGITHHPDLDSQLVSGYDFVSSPEALASSREPGGPEVPFDGDYVDEDEHGPVGRDGNPRDPGDWRGITPQRESTWHGTKIAGLIAADVNGVGIAGIAPKTKVQPVRALSWRGGLLSDIAASITWASGGRVDDVPHNENPSKVINMSFAVETGCPTSLQQAIDGAIQRGSILVAAAGNAGADAATFAPGNCNGVITVAATNRDGNRADYSNYGETIDISAPGGDASNAITVTSNSGSRNAQLPTTVGDRGTSIAAAHVSAAAAILVSRDVSLSLSDAFERLTGRSFTKAFGSDTCDPVHPDYTCGAGIVSLGLAQTASTNCTRTESNLTGNGSGGTVSGRSYVLVTFSTVGSCTWTPPRGVSSVDYLVVGGGGGGGSANRSGRAGGGGGGGEVLQGTGLPVTAGSGLDIQVGAGGAGSRTAAAVGGTGGTSRLGSLQAIGGGGGASVSNIRATVGFTGGGGAAPVSTNRTGAGVSPRKGGNGNTSTSTSYITAGGGAGAGGNGVNGTNTAGGRGGIGISSAITGASLGYGGGGGGGKAYQNYSAGSATDGGGAGGRNANGGNGVNGRGGGGGGAGVWTSSSTFVRPAGNGGSGVVIVRFETPVPDDVRLSYSANGGSGAPSVQLETADSQATVSASSPTRAGYVFVSWNTAADGSGTPYAPNARLTMPWSDLTLYAQWAVLGHLISYEANEGSNAPSEQIAASGETITIAQQGSMTRLGYAFTGWNTSADGSGTDYAAGASLTVSVDLTLYAQWRIRSVTVTYDPNGGVSPPASQTADFDVEIILRASTPSRSGYTFSAWNASADGSGASYQPGGEFTMPADDVTLYAQWAPASQVLNYSANGGTGAPEPQISYAFASVTVPRPEPTRTGYRFTAWNSAIDGTGRSYAPDESLSMPASDLTLFAQWTAITHVISYNTRGGTGAPEASSHAYGTTVTIPAIEPMRTGYMFNGWNTLANGSGVTWNPGNTLTVTEDLTLSAQWLANTYTLRYNANGGGGSPDPAEVSTNASVTVSSIVPTRVGYAFAGWNTRRDGTGSTYASNATLVMPGSDVTLFALWSANNFTVSYNANSGSGSPPGNSSKGYLTSSTVATPTTLSRSGFTFVGWNTSPDGSGSSYAPGTSFLMPASNVVLYAQWLANNYALIYDANGGSGGPPVSSASNGASVSLANDIPVRAGYTFNGWLDASGETYQAGATFTMPSSSAVLRATWLIRSFSLTYSANEGSGIPDGSTQTFGASVTVSAMQPARNGWIFTGWNSRVNGAGTDYAANSTFAMPAEDVTLFAQWRRITTDAADSSSSSPASESSSSSQTSSPIIGLTCRATVCALIRKPMAIPAVAAQSANSHVVSEGNKHSTLSVKPLVANTGIEARGEDFGIVLKGGVPSPSIGGSPGDQGFVLSEGSRIEADGDGFMADSVVRGFIISRESTSIVRALRSSSSAVDLGEVAVDSQGNFSTSWEVPWGLREGSYVLQLNGLNPREEVRSVNVAVFIKRSGSVPVFRVAHRAGFFNPLTANISIVGERKLQNVVEELPPGARLVQVMVTGASVGHESTKRNDKLAAKRAMNLVTELRESGVDTVSVPIVYRTVSSVDELRDSLGAASVLWTSSDKPLSTITLVFQGP